MASSERPSRRELADRKPSDRTTSGRTARGLRRVPPQAAPESAQAAVLADEPRGRRKIKHKLFSRAEGMDMPLFIFIMVLLAVGLVMLFSASYAWGFYHDGSSYYYIQRQGIFALAGVAIMLLLSTFDYHRFHFLALPIYVVAIVLLLAILLLGKVLHLDAIAPPVDYASQSDVYRSIKLGVLFQPSEVAKFAVIAICAHYISRNTDEMHTFLKGFVFPMALVLLPAALIFPEPHLSATLIVLAIGVVLVFVGGAKLRHLLVLGGAGVAGLVLLIVMKGGYQADRISGWLDPFNPDTIMDSTYQIAQSLYAIGSGGLLGVGLGQSRQKYLYLPEPQNDFIFAIVCEELGLVGALIIIILFSLLIWRGMYISLHATEKFGTLLGLGITFQVGIQAVLNICVVTNTVPNTGISLPFFSYGGTSLLMLLAEMGILLNISRSANVEKT